jgi:hypothetical protein
MFPVVWRNAALDQLADAVVRSDLPTQDRIERSVVRINARLARDPYAVGESRPGGYRIEFEAPVGVLFLIDGATEVVIVATFWTY